VLACGSGVKNYSADRGESLRPSERPLQKPFFLSEGGRQAEQKTEGVRLPDYRRKKVGRARWGGTIGRRRRRTHLSLPGEKGKEEPLVEKNKEGGAPSEKEREVFRP